MTAPNELTLHLFPRVEAPAVARAFLREAFQTWALDGFGDITELLTCELVSNVVRHAGSPMTLRVTCHPNAIRVEVDDESPKPPVLTNREPLGAGGRGLVLIDALATNWGSDPRGGGKTVWFVLDTKTAEADKRAPLRASRAPDRDHSANARGAPRHADPRVGVGTPGWSAGRRGSPRVSSQRIGARHGVPGDSR